MAFALGMLFLLGNILVIFADTAAAAPSADGRQPVRPWNNMWWYLYEKDPLASFNEMSATNRLSLYYPTISSGDGHSVSASMAVTVEGFTEDQPATTSRLKFKVAASYVDPYVGPYSWNYAVGFTVRIIKVDGVGVERDPNCLSTSVIFRTDNTDQRGGHNVWSAGSGDPVDPALSGAVLGLLLETNPTLSLFYTLAELIAALRGATGTGGNSPRGSCAAATYGWDALGGYNYDAESFNYVALDVLDSRNNADLGVDIYVDVFWYNWFAIPPGPVATTIGPISLRIKKDLGGVRAVTLSAVAGSDITANSVTVRWAAYNAPDKAYFRNYVVYYRPYRTSAWIQNAWIQTIATASRTVAGLSRNTKYEFMVVVYDVFSRSGPQSNIVLATTAKR